MPRIVVKKMVCVGCGMRIDATIPQAKRHGWKLWVGGARCKTCGEKLSDGEPAPAPTGTKLANILASEDAAARARRRNLRVECDECGKIISGLDYEDGAHPGIHWTITEETRRALRERKVPLPLCVGMRRTGRVVRDAEAAAETTEVSP